jgi:hypothetical protein
MMKIFFRIFPVLAGAAFFFAASVGAEETTSIRVVVTGDTMGQVFPCLK